jgi:hypothetical protein
MSFKPFATNCACCDRRYLKCQRAGLLCIACAHPAIPHEVAADLIELVDLAKPETRDWLNCFLNPTRRSRS